MNKLILFLLFCILFSCNSDDHSETIVTRNFELSIDTEKMDFVNDQFFTNENCNRIYLNMSTSSSVSVPKFLLEIEMTTSGHLKEVFYVDYADNNRHYRSPDFNNSKDFTITNFNYDKLLDSLYFEFSGKIYEFDNPLNSKIISGVIKDDNFETIACSFLPKEIIADIDQEPLFHAVEMIGTSSLEKTKWIAISDNGFKIEIITDQKMKEMPIGTYSFGKADQLNIVTIENYKGPIRATNARFLLDEDWESYEYEGELIIDEQIEKPFRVTKGHFTFKALKGDELVYEITNGRFSI